MGEGSEEARYGHGDPRPPPGPRRNGPRSSHRKAGAVVRCLQALGCRITWAPARSTCTPSRRWQRTRHAQRNKYTHISQIIFSPLSVCVVSDRKRRNLGGNITPFYYYYITVFALAPPRASADSDRGQRPSPAPRAPSVQSERASAAAHRTPGSTRYITLTGLFGVAHPHEWRCECRGPSRASTRPLSCFS